MHLYTHGSKDQIFRETEHDQYQLAELFLGDTYNA